MANQRSRFSLRSQQMLSSGRSMSPSLKLDSEPPPKVKAFIDRVINCPLNDIEIPLSGFHWEYNKGNFHHWRPLFMHFDTYFRTHISCRKDLLLSDDISEKESLPKNSVLQILRVMQIILENCHNKSSFSGLEHFKLLLASTDPEILIATLETLSALVKINPSKLHVSGKMIGCDSINNHLLSLAQGWGSKEEGLGLYSCVVANERNQHEGLSLFPSAVNNESNEAQYRQGSTLHFEFNSSASHIYNQSNEKRKSSNLKIIHIPDLHLRKDDDLVIFKQCVDQFEVPMEHRFSLLTRIRYARAFGTLKTCRLYSRICILAFTILVQSSDAHDELVLFLANEPEYTTELIRVIRSEESVPANIRALATLALGALLAAYASSHERARILSASSVISGGGNRMVLLSVLQKAVLSLSIPNDPSSPLFVDALLQFFQLHVLSSSTSGSAVRSSGMVQPLLPLLQNNEPSHIHLVSSAVKTLQKLMEYSSPSASLFKDLGGVELLSRRLQIEVHRVIAAADGSTSDLIVSAERLKCEDNHLYSQKQLIKTLLKALGSAKYSPRNNSRSQNSDDISVPATLSLIFQNVTIFGGDIYYSAVTFMSEIIHTDPTCYPLLDQSGLPDSFLSSVQSGILPSSKALICIPSGLGAICLNNKGLEAIKSNSALRFLIETFTTRKYMKAMNDGVVLLANAVEELLRHVSSLRSTGVEIIVEIINKLSSVGDEKCETTMKADENSISMETDTKEKASQDHDLMNDMVTSADDISDEQFVQLCAFHVMVLVHRTMENTETCRLFVEKGGIDGLLKLLLRPSITRSVEGMPIALHSTIVFKGFTQHHSSHLARAFCSSLKDHLDKALGGFSSSSSEPLLPTRATPDSGIMSSLFVIEFLLFLAASKDNRWINALLTEFADSSKAVLEDIGRIHREVLWQLALFEDSKIETIDCESSTSVNETHRSDSGTSESEGLRYSSSFRQYLDPLLRRRSSGRSIESQVSDLISVYRDLDRATSGPQRIRSDSLLNSRFASSHLSLESNSSDANGNTSPVTTEEYKKKLFNSSCRDMMKSLSFHISHLFMELGRTMLFSPRRETVSSLPSSVTSVCITLSSISLEHLNFRGHADSSQSVVPMSTKCRYLGKVIEFIDSVLLDKPDSCNSILLNCFYSCGVIQSVLSTFEATSQLLFAVNGFSSSPMETNEMISKQENGEADNSWIYGPLSSYCTLLDHCVTSSFILSSTSKQLLEQPFPNAVVPLPQDAEAFVKVLQSKVLKAILPIWTNPHFVDHNLEFIIGTISIIKHIYSGVKTRNVNGNTSNVRAGPPPDETSISMIVEMGFPRARAEEALRHVGANSVALATDWLFSHPEEPQEEDELARALAMSLRNSGTPLKDAEDSGTENYLQEEELVELPHIDKILAACVKLLQVKESLAFTVRDLLVMIGSQNDGDYQPKVLTFIIDNIKSCSASDPSSNTSLSSLFHVLALILHNDSSARDIVSQAGLVKIAVNLLSDWDKSFIQDGEKSQVPNWVTACFLSIDRQLQVDPKLTPEMFEFDQLKKEDLGTQISVVIDDINQKKDSKQLEPMSGIIDLNDQKRLIEISCRCIQNQLPSETLHAVIQLCASLTKVHSVAVSFFEAGGLLALLSLPTSSLFSGFNKLAATIIRHILEDAHTLQQVMELEIRHCLVTATNRNGNVGVTPRIFVHSMSFIIQRNPAIFMQAARAVCEIEMVSDRPYVVLLKDRDKEKCKENDKATEKDRQFSPVKGSCAKVIDSNSKTGKVHRKSPQSFVAVIEHLLDMIATFIPPRADNLIDGADAQGKPAHVDMDVDSSIASSKGKGKAVSDEESNTFCEESSTSTAKTVFTLKLLTEILLTYPPSIYVLLRRDVEISSFRGSSQKALSTNFTGGIFQHILHEFLPYSGSYKKDKKALENDWSHKLAIRANQFLVASSIRSTEARKRIFSEIKNTFDEFVSLSNGCRAPNITMHAFIDMLNDVLSSRSTTGSYISADASVTFIDVGLVKSLTRTMQVLDLDYADSPKVVTGIIRALDLVTKEHVQSADRNSAKEGNLSKPNIDQQNQIDSSYIDGNRFQPLDTTYQPDHDENIDSLNPGPNLTTTDSVDDMVHDHDIDEGFAPEADVDFMHENLEDGGSMENNIATVEIRFDIGQNAQGGDLGGANNDDEDMSEDGEDGDEDDDEEGNNELEEDEVHQILHPDTDQDDHEIDEEFDEDILEEEEEDEDDDGVILRLEERINRNFDQIENFSGRNNHSSETMRVIPLDIFGSRRQDRTTSIYNLLGQAGERGGHNEHPLLEEPSSFRSLIQTQSESMVDIAFSDRHHEIISARLDAMFRTLGSGRSGHRFNVWLDDTPQRSVPNPPPVLQGIEELVVSQLRRPTLALGQSSGQDVQVVPPQEQDNPSHLQNSDATLRDETPTEHNEINGNTGVPSPVNQERHQVNTQEQREVEEVSQERRGFGAIVEELHNSDVDAGSADINITSVNSSDVNLGSVSEVLPNSNPEDNHNRNDDSESIDPAFLEALPEHLRTEVINSQQNQQSAQPSGEQSQADEEIDPEFLAALPPDIREEVLAQQRAQRRQTQSHELEGQPVEMDAVSILATFPSEIREEVLLTSPDTLLSTLTPALVAEANMLRERFAHRFHNSSIFGLQSRNRRGDSSRRGDITGSSLGRTAVDTATRRPLGGKVLETVGTPLVGSDDLKAIFRILCIVQPLYKGQYLKLLLSLCAHNETRTSIVQILMDMLMLDLWGSDNRKADSYESPYRLYGCQKYIIYSRPQFSNGVPPLLSRRILETLTYLARNHPFVVKLLLKYELQNPASCNSVRSFHGRGKSIVIEENKSEDQNGNFAVVLLLRLLNQPLYMRSIAHLEQLLNLIEVIVVNSISDSEMSTESVEPSQQSSGSHDVPMNVDAAPACTDGEPHAVDSELSEVDGKVGPSAAPKYRENSICSVLLQLPPGELQLLCSLLARKGLSENVYVLVAEVLKKLVAIAPTYCHLFITELANSVHDLTASAMTELYLYMDAESALLTTSSSGTSVLRVLQSLSSLVSTLHEKKDPQVLKEKEYTDALSQVSKINSSLESLWVELSKSISNIESASNLVPDLSAMSEDSASTNAGNTMPPLPAGTQNILPYIESFFVACEKLCPEQSELPQELGTAPISDSFAKVEEKNAAFIKFSEKHRKLLNAFIRQNPGLIEKSFSIMLKVPRFIDFDNKRAHFRSKIKHQHDHHHSPVRISVRRAYILEDSYNQLRMRSPQDLKGRLNVLFQGEEGIDAGGLTREWYQMISRVIFDKGALLFTTVGNESTFQPNPNSVYQTEHLSYFKFVGRVVGKALFDGQLLDVHFTRSFYKHILGVKVTYHDIEAIDPDFYKNLKWMLENDITDVLDLTFSMDADEEKMILYERTEVTDSELIPGGRNIKVTEENKHEYVDRVVEHRLTTAIRPQINSFMEGFNEMIFQDLISIFNDKELELLISGLPEIDLDDLKANTEYSGYTSASPVIQWFWEVVNGFSKEDKARFLQFVTGTSKVPLEGFSALQGISGTQRFQIHKAYGTSDHLPSAHTCFNQLDLPEYSSKERLLERLLLAIHEANEGFGFG